MSTIYDNILIMNDMCIKLYLSRREKLFLYTVTNHQLSVNNERLKTSRIFKKLTKLAVQPIVKNVTQNKQHRLFRIQNWSYIFVHFSFAGFIYAIIFIQKFLLPLLFVSTSFPFFSEFNSSYISSKKPCPSTEFLKPSLILPLLNCLGDSQLFLYSEQYLFSPLRVTHRLLLSLTVVFCPLLISPRVSESLNIRAGRDGRDQLFPVLHFTEEPRLPTEK